MDLSYSPKYEAFRREARDFLEKNRDRASSGSIAMRLGEKDPKTLEWQRILIEHGYAATAEVLELMRERGVALCPTLAASEAVARYRGWQEGEPEPQSVRESREMFARALEAGVTIALGSDVGVFAHGDNVRELELMVAGGMSPAAALRSATVVAAGVLEREDLG